MTSPTFLMVLVAGAAALAMWLVGRFPGWLPGSLRAALIHFGLALALVWTMPNLVAPLAALGRPSALAAIFVFVLPPLTYGFLAGAWIVRLAHQALTQ
jgi:hypothetical protein